MTCDENENTVEKLGAFTTRIITVISILSFFGGP
jgi:hypothetical protein